MLLLHSRTFKFKRIEGGDIPPYAILSHRWGNPEDEVSYQEMCDGSGTLKGGYSKIERCGEMASSHGFEYFWVDTCCIDKSSSAELSEGINSMYAWYRNAAICYAYLGDVSAESSCHPVFPTMSEFKRSSWFTRVWTLQELIAPPVVRFFSKDWQEIGTKKTLKGHIAEITGIQTKVLEGADLGQFSVSERMSWASKRISTRVEDMAYSLLGILEVNLPLLYGEGEKSFIRLQEEFMKKSDDQSLFAWTDSSPASEAYTGLLARSPKNFEHSGKFSSLGVWSRSDGFSMTNKGIRAELFLVPYLQENEVYRASLDCTVKGSNSHAPAIYLKRLSNPIDSTPPDSMITHCLAQFARIKADRIDEMEATERASGTYTVVYVRQSYKFLQQISQDSKKNLTFFQIKHITCKPVSIQPRAIYPAGHWNPQTELFFPSTAVGKLGAIFFNHDGVRYMIILGLSELYQPWSRILHSISQDPYQDWEAYKTTGREQSQSKVKFWSSDNQITINTMLSRSLDVYGTSVITVGCVFETMARRLVESHAYFERKRNRPDGFFSNMIADISGLFR